MDRGRLEAFSDGVIAVAITLLALNLAVAGPGHGSLLQQLGEHWPSFVAYVISFFVIGIVWVNHHGLVRNIAVVDRTLLFLNLMLLLFVVLIPFATATMATYLTSGDQDAHIATALYGVVLEGMAISFAAIFWWTLGEGRTHQPVPKEAQRTVWLQFSIGGVVYIVAIGIAFLSAPLALIQGRGDVGVLVAARRRAGTHPDTLLRGEGVTRPGGRRVCASGRGRPHRRLRLGCGKAPSDCRLRSGWWQSADTARGRWQGFGNRPTTSTRSTDGRPSDRARNAGSTDSGEGGRGRCGAVRWPRSPACWLRSSP
ncbi:MAG: DUF1211 domain-containing protein [Chloroflexi bacterium]|nr:MAG: DUF1211 domain-containing protein [Chloroflexota bacterium]